MKFFIQFIFTLGLLFTNTIYCQNQSGIITYHGVINEKFVDSFTTTIKQKDIPMASKQILLKALNNTLPDEYELNFKNEESYYFKKPALEEQSLLDSRAGSVPYYTNNATDTIVGMSSSLGKIAHKPLDWKITNKTKNIGDYKCYQAVVTEKLYSRQGHYYYKKVIAWFTPEVPISFGPKYYKGLPGLILQIEDKEYTLTATKINLNPSEGIKIKRLEKNDKVITQEESFRRIEEMTGDMKKRYDN